MVRGQSHTWQQALSTPEDGRSGHRHLPFRDEPGSPYRGAASGGRGDIDQHQGRRTPPRDQPGRWQPDPHRSPYRRSRNRHEPLRGRTARASQRFTRRSSLSPLRGGRKSAGRPPAARCSTPASRNAAPCAARGRSGTGPERNGLPLRLEVDHINGDWWDNRKENHQLLCPNCHAVTDTYRGRKRRARG